MTRSEPTEPGFADVTVHPRFELGWNKLQTVIEIVVAIILTGGALGIFGGGPLSHATGAVPGTHDILIYDRFVRRTVQSEMRIDIRDPVATPWIDIELPQGFLDRNDVTAMSPRSSRMAANADGVIYRFDLGAARTGAIVLSLKPQSFGWSAQKIHILGTDLKVNQFIWP